MVDPRTPVLVGTGQLSQRVDRGEPELEPVDLLVEATKQAERDTEGPDGKVLAAVDSVRMVSTLSWRYRDPARLVAERLGLDVRHTVYTHAGGQTPQALLSRTCRDIIDGKLDVALIGGAEAWRTRMSWRARGERPAWTRQPDDVAPTEMFGTDLAMVSELEQERGVFMPVQVYPMFESALRAADGRSPEEHRLRVSELWARFSEAAAGNPNAWIQQRYSAEAIRTAGPDNRMIGLPYPKLMNSNNAVEQAAALLVCSVETAERLAVPRDRWVFVHAGADAADTIHVSNRADLYSSPAIRQAGRAALELGGAGIDDIAHIDLYSCFPSAVQVAAAELGLSVDDAIAGHRPLTVTGGLSFAGGPWNNYVTHSIATMANRLRQEPGSLGLVAASSRSTRSGSTRRNLPRPGCSAGPMLNRTPMPASFPST